MDTRSPDAGMFGPGSEAWALDREAMLLLGAGPRALLLQLAHPSVAAGVADHSDFRADPWRRLDGTLRSYLRIIYGSTAQARAEIRRLNTLHRSITGPGYRARDPDLALWVHATLVDSTIVANDAWLGPLPRARAARFYEESRSLGRVFGVPDAALPRDLDAFEAYLANQLGPDGPVRVGATARDLAEAVVHPPLPGLLARLPLDPRLHAWTLWPAIGLLPPTIRDAYGFDWNLRHRLVSRWLVTTWRAWNTVLPPVVRHMPQALAADRRVASGADPRISASPPNARPRNVRRTFRRSDARFAAQMRLSLAAPRTITRGFVAEDPATEAISPPKAPPDEHLAES